MNIEMGIGKSIVIGNVGTYKIWCEVMLKNTDQGKEKLKRERVTVVQGSIQYYWPAYAIHPGGQRMRIYPHPSQKRPETRIMSHTWELRKAW